LVSVSALPVNDHSALQSKAVLAVVVVADCQATVIAKASVQIFSLDEPEREFVTQLDLKAPACRQGESVLREGSPARGIDARNCGALATERYTRSAEVDLDKWFEPAATSIGKPRPEQVGKLIPVNRVADCGVVSQYLAPTQVSSYPDQTTKVVGERAAATNAI
jgi:hypothetical protein